jgi:hypothetical protein
MVAEEPITLIAKKKNLVLGCLSKIPEGGIPEHGGEITLGKKEVSEIRWQVVRYLNILESIFAGCKHGVADEAILIEEFGFLDSPTEGHHLLKRFRDKVGPQGYPGIEWLESRLAEMRQNRPERPAPLPSRLR